MHQCSRSCAAVIVVLGAADAAGLKVAQTQSTHRCHKVNSQRLSQLG